MIKKEMTLLDIIEKYPCTQEVFNEYNDVTEKCILCTYLFETLEDMSIICNLDKKEIVEKLNKVIKIGQQ